MSEFIIVNNRGVSKKLCEELIVDGFGIETDSKRACWGPGRRPVRLLHFILSGSGFFNGHPVSAGQGFYATPNQLHEYHSSKDNPWSYLWISFGGNFASDFCNSLKTDESGIFTFTINEEISLVCDKIKCFSSSGQMLEFAEGLRLFFSLLSTCVFLHDFSRDNDLSVLNVSKQFIKQNYYRNIKIRDVADYANVSPNYLTNIFLKSGEKSPKNYLSELRIEKACSLLADNTISITEVAVSVGYSDPLQFSRFFSRHTGMSPTKYRNQ